MPHCKTLEEMRALRTPCASPMYIPPCNVQSPALSPALSQGCFTPVQAVTTTVVHGPHTSYPVVHGQPHTTTTTTITTAVDACNGCMFFPQRCIDGRPLSMWCAYCLRQRLYPDLATESMCPRNGCVLPSRCYREF